ncbi:hypothetical protein [Paenibacillus xylanexedens]|uniref:hypothetical protein n=1 Tax=Paenibacillus xylanexedens TaxID=528191 RepID=UPI00164286DB|nr:hypothetical protein [Paenibacillus xylanexedens]
MEFRWIHTGTDAGADLHFIFCSTVVLDGYEAIPQVQMIIIADHDSAILCWLSS